MTVKSRDRSHDGTAGKVLSRGTEIEIKSSPSLPPSFYSRKAPLVAKELLGKILFHRVGSILLAGKIVEAEAYLGSADPCSHAFRGPTPRCSVMFGKPGHAYVYFIYGNHYCFNVVAHEEKGDAGAVLIRAVEPLVGIPEMIKRRKTENLKNLTNGPGKLTQALAITRKQNGADLSQGNFSIFDGGFPSGPLTESPRVGISKAMEKLYRFSVTGNPFVSRPLP